MRHTLTLVLCSSLVGVIGVTSSCTVVPESLVAASGTTAPHTYAIEAVASDHRLASEAGARILREGGNAVDAAVATSLALSVVRPVSCGIGGGGFMVIAMPDDPVHGWVLTAYDYRERAPSGVSERFFENEPDDASRHSGKAVAVPGTVDGLFAAHSEFGRLAWADVCAPAIDLALDGWVVDDHTQTYGRSLRSFLDAREDADPFMADRFAGVRRGERLTNPEQASALRLIADRGPRGYYEGPVARAIVETVRERGGVMTLGDLGAYEPKRVEPIVEEIFGKTFVAMPLPSSGGVTMLQALKILEARSSDWGGAEGPSDPRYAHTLVESMKHAFADRAAHLGDPEFDVIPVEALLSEESIERRARRVHPDRTFEPWYYAEASQVVSGAGTSHASIVDRWGNAVAITETINLAWGAKFTARGYGFALNNQMDDFMAKRGTVNAFGLVQSERNLPDAGKRPLSSMSPTIVLSDDGSEVEIVAGASGGPRIITGTMQAVLNALVFDMDAEDAVSAPRLHHQWVPGHVFAETWSSRDALLEWNLRDRGHGLELREDVGHVQLIRRRGDALQAASDPRKGGIPAGR